MIRNKLLLIIFIFFITSFQTVDANESVKKQLDSLALSALNAAEKHNSIKMTEYIDKMVDLGATGGTDPQIIKKQTPSCPAVKIMLNHKQLSGSLCAKMGYEYNNQVYWVGYCKP